MIIDIYNQDHNFFNKKLVKIIFTGIVFVLCHKTKHTNFICE